MDKDDSGISRRLALSAVAAAAAAAAAACRHVPPVLPALDHLRARRATEPLPRRDPESPLWDHTEEFSTALVPQNVIAPMIERPGVARVKARALHDGRWIAFRLEWRDGSRNMLHGPSIFSDAAAVQVPREPGPDPLVMMGHPGSPVRVLFWKAAWQTADPLAALHPNRPPTDYPFEAAPPEHRTRMAETYSPAVNAHNPNHHRPGDPPVFLGEAEQYGTLTAVRNVELDGRGAHREGVWRAVLATPIANLGNAVRVGRSTSVAFAVWEGSAQNSGSRKMRSEGWSRLVLD